MAAIVDRRGHRRFAWIVAKLMPTVGEMNDTYAKPGRVELFEFAYSAAYRRVIQERYKGVLTAPLLLPGVMLQVTQPDGQLAAVRLSASEVVILRDALSVWIGETGLQEVDEALKPLSRSLDSVSSEV